MGKEGKKRKNNEKQGKRRKNKRGKGETKRGGVGVINIGGTSNARGTASRGRFPYFSS
jgi:hypothetical protein